MSVFPEYRPRRLRRTDLMRSLVRETTVQVTDFILPLFVAPGTGFRKPINSMPGVFQTSVDELVKDAKEAADLGIPGVILFGIPESKDERGTSGYADDGIVPQGIRAIKKAVPNLLVI